MRPCDPDHDDCPMSGLRGPLRSTALCRKRYKRKCQTMEKPTGCQKLRRACATGLICSLFLAEIAHAGLLIPDAAPLDVEGMRALARPHFEMPEMAAPTFPDREVKITDHGAVGDGRTLNTDAFEAAIAACAEAGGGRVLVPPGVWLTGPIQLRSQIDLHVAAGAVVLFSPDVTLYQPTRDLGGAGSSPARRWRAVSPLSGEDLENVAITGRGLFHGSGDAWRPVKKSKMTERQWRELLSKGGYVDDQESWHPAEDGRTQFRPNMLRLVGCRNVVIEGPTFQNSPSWTIHPLLCEGLIINDVRVKNPWHGANCDALDVESCSGVILANCVFDTGDDGICLKSGRDEAGRQRGKPTERMVIKDCTVFRAHGGFTIGSEMSGGVRDVLVKDCTFVNTDIGLRFKATRGRGNKVERIWIDGVAMIDIINAAIDFNLFYGGQGPGEEGERGHQTPMAPVDETTPEFRDIDVRNVWCNGAERAAYVIGLPEMPVANLSLRDVTLKADRGITLMDAEGVKLERVTIQAADGPAITLINSRAIEISETRSVPGSALFLKLEGERTGAVTLDRIDTGGAKSSESASEVPAGAVTQ